ncbi:MAG: energy-coupling factor transporter transmembrane protein EcfT [Flexistipes sinusarabici]|uniref:Energy-coupling factor transporter transmembrane protein EcfT n=1 Tax=Flexistipes sinusarabici TaxID=2352 RepID=A0A5D0MJ51_FLESI|nr:energy-coupling factor transporter transmembrane component T [Flexistipes sinusarabici]TYB33764.1 MAG: energy-coupling factor transporter transmembrane protein EcfT [Flexistipes sinusarabici]
MLKKNYFGKYRYKNSIFHNLHPLAKFLIIISSIILTGLSISLSKIFFLIAVFLIFLSASKISSKEIYSIFKPFRFLLIFTYLIQLFFDNTGFNPGNLNYTAAAAVTLKFSLMILFSAIFTATTRPLDIIKILNLLLKPLKIFKVNTQDITASGIIALRFIPLLFEEADKIRTAQILRNEVAHKGFKRIFQIEAFIVPLFFRVVHFSEQIAITLKFRDNWEKVYKFERIRVSEIILTAIYLILLAGLYYV